MISKATHDTTPAKTALARWGALAFMLFFVKGLLWLAAPMVLYHWL